MVDQFWLRRMPAPQSTEAVKRACRYAKWAYEHDRRPSHTLTSEYLIAGLIRQPEPNEPSQEALQILRRLQIESADVFAGICVDEPAQQGRAELVGSAVLGRAVSEANRIRELLGGKVITTGQLLCALATDRESQAYRTMTKLGIDGDRILDLLTLGRDSIEPQTFGQYFRQLTTVERRSMIEAGSCRYSSLPPAIKKSLENAVATGRVAVEIDRHGTIQLTDTLVGDQTELSISVPVQRPVLVVRIMTGAPLTPEE